jgi:saccharopine dehydrogenase-like NADP-dependent oxidoreductase
LLGDVSVVVMCVEGRDTRFVEQCIGRGIRYTDISATYELLARIESLEQVAEVDVFILLGMGEAHGESSIEWVLDNLNSE